MKKLLFLLAIATGLSLASCTKEDFSTDILEESEFTTSLISDNDLLGSLEELNAAARGGGDGPGDFKGKKLKEISADSLSDVIKTYIDANYAGSTIVKAFQGKGGAVVVIITKADGTKVGLLFDSTGAFQKEVNKKNHGGGKNLTEVDVTSLPNSVSTHITSTYIGSTISKAFTTPEGKYIVVVTKADGTKIAVLFDKDGNFEKELPKHGKGALTSVDITTLSTSIKDYVSTNYANSTIEKAYKDPSGNILLSVKTTDGKIVRLMFDSNGTFVKVLKKK